MNSVFCDLSTSIKIVIRDIQFVFTIRINKNKIDDIARYFFNLMTSKRAREFSNKP